MGWPYYLFITIVVVLFIYGYYLAIKYVLKYSDEVEANETAKKDVTKCKTALDEQTKSMLALKDLPQQIKTCETNLKECKSEKDELLVKCPDVKP